MRPLHLACLTLAIIGAINWGLWGFFQFDLVAAIFGGQTAPAARVVYSLVGVAGLCLIGTTLAIYGGQGTELAGRRTHMAPRP